MLYYIKTIVSTQSLKKPMEYYLDLFSYNIHNNELNSYLIFNYKINLNSILKNIIRYCKLNEVENCIYQIYFDKNAYIGKEKLSNIIQLLEYGNLDIQPPKIISKWIKNTLDFVRYRTGGY